MDSVSSIQNSSCHFLGFIVVSFIHFFFCLISTIEYLTSEERGSDGNWFAYDMAQARLDKYYWFLAASIGVTLLAFLIFSRLF